MQFWWPGKPRRDVEEEVPESSLRRIKKKYIGMLGRKY